MITLAAADGRLLAYWAQEDLGEADDLLQSREAAARQREHQHQRHPGASAAPGTSVASKDKKKRKKPAKTEPDDTNSFLHVLGALQLASIRFANTLQVSECPVLHVKGDRIVFSCYAVADNQILALYSSPKSGTVSHFDTTKLDTAIQPILDDLELALQNVQL
ncbi:Hypothetical Protein FCC1311_109982 [Hondaea fermentalgiana]|uniref:Uncharacterized protein n=1 Tax=Hondaea fermentalgiana TaxID=2315210 RepID=A0A2R5GVA3_9STRA|nr:Hypothetical Protein FCC1311_109982 [Hondaea fermentalgiana]|eukprot:GBG34776.1 Hypothetical Protein FCC1311_109982 [Hondaea fermentalgiana]